MAQVTAAATAHLHAPAQLLIHIIRDFDGHHRSILPRAFSDFVVEQGGVGAGTVMSFTTTLGGKPVRGRSRASEPEPGVIREDIDGGDMATLFRVTPEGHGSRVEITTSWTPASLGERLVAPFLLRRIYRQELRLLARHAAYVEGYRAELVGAA